MPALDVGRAMSPRELHAYTCSLLGIRDPALVARAWDERRAREGEAG
jgi:hypothetical protein